VDIAQLSEKMAPKTMSLYALQSQSNKCMTSERVVLSDIIIIIIIFLPSFAYDPDGFQKLDRLQKNYKISWNDLTSSTKQS